MISPEVNAVCDVHSMKPGEVSMPNVAVSCEDERGRVSSLFHP